MHKIIKKLILLGLFVGCCATLLMTWTDNSVQTLNGTSIFTGNLFLTLFIWGTYGLSVLFYEKAKRVFFCMGLASLSMFFAIMFSKFEHWGRFANDCVGPYLGLSSVVLTMVAYVLLNIKSEKSVG